MASLTFYGGVNEIGGNKILLSDRKTNLFLDFGQSFSLLDQYFMPENYLLPRERFGLKDYFEFGLVPKLPGLYAQPAIERTDLPFTKEACFDGVLITHAHQDHVAHLKYLHPGIPIYMGETTKAILESTAQTTGKAFWNPEADIRTFRTGQQLSIGDVRATPVHVDHSVPGAYGFLIETSSGTVAYTGDLRAHGRRPDLTSDFLSKAASSDCAALIIEGTRVTHEEKRKNHTEAFVQSESLKLATEAKGMVLAMRYPKDLDRLMSFYSIAKETGRQLVISQKSAHLLEALRSDSGLQLPDPWSDASILVYGRELKKEKKWQKEMKDGCIDAAYVHAHAASLIFELDFYYFNELVDVQPSGGVCIHSMSEPFEEDPVSVISDEVLDHWLNHYGLSRHQLHASGHASKPEIMKMITDLAPKQVFPVHTHQPELFKESGANIVVPVKDKKFEF